MRDTVKLPVTLKARLLTLFLQKTVMSSVMPFMALYFTELYNSSISGSLLIFSLLINFISLLIGGRIADSFNKKRLVLVLMIFNVIIFFTMSASSYYESHLIYLFILAYFLQQIISGLILPSQEALALISVTDENREKYSTYQYWLNNVSLSIGVIIGGLFYESSKEILFLILSLVIIISIFIVLRYVDEDYIDNQKFIWRNILIDTYESYKIAFRDKYYTLLLLGFSLVLLIELSMNNYVIVRLKEQFHTIEFWNFSIDGVLMFSILIVINTVIVAIFSLYVGMLSEKLKFKNAIYISIATYSIGYMIIMFSNNIYILIIFMILASIGEMIYAPKYTSLRVSLIPKERRGSYSSVSALSSQFSSLLSRLTLVLYAFTTPISISLVLFILSILGFLLMIFVYKKVSTI